MFYKKRKRIITKGFQWHVLQTLNRKKNIILKYSLSFQMDIKKNYNFSQRMKRMMIKLL